MFENGVCECVWGLAGIEQGLVCVWVYEPLKLARYFWDYFTFVFCHMWAFGKAFYLSGFSGSRTSCEQYSFWQGLKIKFMN